MKITKTIIFYPLCIPCRLFFLIDTNATCFPLFVIRDHPEGIKKVFLFRKQRLSKLWITIPAIRLASLEYQQTKAGVS